MGDRTTPSPWQRLVPYGQTMPVRPLSACPRVSTRLEFSAKEIEGRSYRPYASRPVAGIRAARREIDKQSRRARPATDAGKRTGNAEEFRYAVSRKPHEKERDIGCALFRR